MGAVDCAFSGVGELAARLETRFRGQVVCIDDEPQICVGQHLDGLTQGRLIASTFLAASSDVTCFIVSSRRPRRRRRFAGSLEVTRIVIL